MNTPMFSVAIPSKNRADRLENAIRSVLQQQFQDFEILVCDNSDEAESAETQALVARLDDQRIRYIRTNGQLSMPDNWERSIADARGEYVGILTDRSVYRRDALQICYDEIQRSQATLVCWLPDHFGRDAAGREYRRRHSTQQRYDIDSREVLNYFLQGHPKFAGKVVPKLMSAMCARSVLDEIRRSPVGRVCPPVCPDYTSGFQMLAYSKHVRFVDDSLFISCGVGNGSAFRRRGALAERFRRDLGMSWKDLVDRMPSEACFTHALVLNDFVRLKEQVPERFAGLDVNPVQYYLGCLSDYVRSARHGADRTEDFDALIEGLCAEPPDVQEAVRSRQLYLTSTLILPARITNVDPDDDEGGEGDGVKFSSVFEAMAWAEQHPLPPAADGLMAMPPLSDMKLWTSTKEKTRAHAAMSGEAR